LADISDTSKSRCQREAQALTDGATFHARIADLLCEIKSSSHKGFSNKIGAQARTRSRGGNLSTFLVITASIC
jgi:hypothetical protein